MPVRRAARLRFAELSVSGTLTQVGVGGLIFRTDVLPEPGERGEVSIGGSPGVPVRVVWGRAASREGSAGLGLAFELPDTEAERRALELILQILDGPSVRE